MKNFKEYLSETRFEYNPETFKYDPTDVAEIAKDREHAHNWGYVQSPHGHYQHFTGRGEVFTPEYVRMWRLRGTHMENDPSNPYLPYKPDYSGYGEHLGAEAPGKLLAFEKEKQSEPVEKPVDANQSLMTLQQIADKVGLSKQRVDQIHQTALAKIAHGLLRTGFTPGDHSSEIPNPTEQERAEMIRRGEEIEAKERRELDRGRVGGKGDESLPTVNRIKRSKYKNP